MCEFVSSFQLYFFYILLLSLKFSLPSLNMNCYQLNEGHSELQLHTKRDIMRVHGAVNDSEALDN